MPVFGASRSTARVCGSSPCPSAPMCQTTASVNWPSSGPPSGNPAQLSMILTDPCDMSGTSPWPSVTAWPTRVSVTWCLTVTSCVTSTPGAAPPSRTPASSPWPPAAPGSGHWTSASAMSRITASVTWSRGCPASASSRCEDVSWSGTPGSSQCHEDVVTSWHSTSWSVTCHYKLSTLRHESWGDAT